MVMERLFGLNSVGSALSIARRELFKLYVNETHLRNKKNKHQPKPIKDLIQVAHQQKTPIEFVKRDVLDTKAGHGRVHQGVVLECSPLPIGILHEEIPSPQDDAVSMRIYLAADKVQDPVNLGALFRLGLFFDCQGILLSKECCPLSPAVSRASTGAMELLAAYDTPNLSHVLQHAKANQDAIIYGATSNTHKNAIPSFELKYEKQTTILVFGNEGRGLSLNVLRLCDQLIHIPSNFKGIGWLPSLNVATAASCLLHQLRFVEHQSRTALG